MVEYPVGATATTFRLLAELSDGDAAGVTELATRLDCAKGTVHNHLVTLERLGYVEKSDGRYRLGFRFLDLATRVRERNVLYRVGRAEVERLADATGEATSLVVAEDGEAVFVFRAGDDPGTGLREGSRVPLHACAAGKAILANRPRAETDAVFDGRVATSTERTTTDRDAFVSELQTVRDQGLAFDRGELDPDRRAVAAPIVVDESAVGALTVAGPVDRMSGKRLEEDVPGLVLSSAKTITVEYTKH